MTTCTAHDLDAVDGAPRPRDRSLPALHRT